MKVLCTSNFGADESFDLEIGTIYTASSRRLTPCSRLSNTFVYEIEERGNKAYWEGWFKEVCDAEIALLREEQDAQASAASKDE